MSIETDPVIWRLHTETAPPAHREAGLRRIRLLIFDLLEYVGLLIFILTRTPQLMNLKKYAR